jgi:hypothetical protein
MTKDEILSKFFGGYRGGKFDILDKEHLADKAEKHSGIN